MDFWMIARQELKHDLLDIFSVLGNLQHQYDWVITDHDLWYAENCPEEVRRRWQWTGLLVDGTELTEHLSAGYIRFLLGGVLSSAERYAALCGLELRAVLGDRAVRFTGVPFPDTVHPAGADLL